MSSPTVEKCKRREGPVSDPEEIGTPVFKKMANAAYQQFASLDLDTSKSLGPVDLELKFQNVLLSGGDKKTIPAPESAERSQALANVAKELLSLTPRSRLERYQGMLDNNPSLKLISRVAMTERVAGLKQMIDSGMDTGLGANRFLNLKTTKADLAVLKTDKGAIRYTCMMDSTYIDQEWLINVKTPGDPFQKKIAKVEDALHISNFLLKVMDQIGHPNSITQKDLHQVVQNAKAPTTKANYSFNIREWKALTTLAENGHLLAYMDPQQSKLPDRYRHKGRTDTDNIAITRNAIAKFQNEVVTNPWNLSEKSQHSDAGIARTILVKVYRHILYPSKTSKGFQYHRLNH